MQLKSYISLEHAIATFGAFDTPETRDGFATLVPTTDAKATSEALTQRGYCMTSPVPTQD